MNYCDISMEYNDIIKLGISIKVNCSLWEGILLLLFIVVVQTNVTSIKLFNI